MLQFSAGHSRLASTLVFAEHDGTKLNPGTLHAMTAAKAVGGDITALVAGDKCADVAKQVAQIAGVSKVSALSFGSKMQIVVNFEY